MTRSALVGITAVTAVVIGPLATPARAAGPTITGVAPSVSANSNAAQPVTFSGYTSVTAPTSATLTMGGTTITGAISAATTSQTTATFDLSGAPTGAYNANLSASGVPEASCTACFTVHAAPTVAGTSPASDENQLNEGVKTLTLAGTGFAGGATFKLTHAGQSDIVATNVSVTSATSMSGKVDLTDAAPYVGSDWSIVVTNTDTGTGSCACLNVTAAAAPSITQTNPLELGQGATPATSVEVDGSGFAHGAIVSFADPKVVTGTTTFVSSSKLTVPVTVAADATVGASSLTVTNTDGQHDVCATCFTVDAAPTVGAPSPATAGQGATARSVTIVGTGFRAGATVTFSGAGVTAGTAVVNSATSITVPVSVTSGAATGARDITVTNADGSHGTNSGAFTIDTAPGSIAVDPSSRAQGTSGSENITGTGFVSGATVSVSGAGVAVSNVGFTSATALTADFTVDPSAPSGARTVTVTNPDGGVGSASAFSVGAAPTITSVMPSTGGQGATDRALTIQGTGFTPTSTVLVSGDGITRQPVGFVDSSHLTMSIAIASTATLGARDVTVTNPSDGGTVTAAGAFTVTAPPAATNLAPGALGQGASGASVVVTGTGFATGMTASFAGTGVSVDSITTDSATQATLHVSVAGTATTGARALTLTNADGGTTTGDVSLTVDAAPSVTGVVPADAAQGATVDVTISGTGFVTGAVVSVGGTGVTASAPVVTNATTMTARFTIAVSAATTNRTVTVTNPDDGVGTSATGVFQVDPGPTITSTTPSAISNSGSPHSRSITFTGTGFTLGGTTMTLTMAGQPDVVATGATATSSTSASGTFVIEALKPGAWKPVLTNPDGSTATCTCSVTVLGVAPTVTSITPNGSGQGASGVSVSVVGTGFSNGTALTFSGTGVTATNVMVVDAKHLTADVTVAPDAAATARDVTVTNADAQAGTLAGGFTVHPAPVVSSLSPSSRAQGTATDGVAISGTGFANGMTLDLGSGVTVTNLVITGATSATATTTVAGNAAPGARSATATNSDGGTSTTTDAFTVDATPTVSMAGPALGQGATARTVTVTGTGFRPGAVVTFAKTGATGTVTAGSSTVAGDGTNLTVPVTVAATATIGTWDVTVTNTDAGTATAPGAFTVDAPPTITSVAPASVGRFSSTTATVSGTGFATGMTVTFDGSGVTFTVSTVSATAATGTLTVSAGATLGAHAMTVTNTDAGSATKAAALTVTPAPTVTSVTPAVVDGTTTRVSVHGSGFTGTPTVAFSSGITGASVTRVDAFTLTLTVTVPATVSPGTAAIGVRNPDGGTVVCTTCVTVLGHSLISLAAAPHTIVAGKSARLTGVLRDATRGPLGGRIVTLQIASASGLTAVAQATTSAAGSFAFTVKPMHDIGYQVSFPGDGTESATNGLVAVLVGWHVTVVTGGVGKHGTGGAAFTVTVASSPNAAGAVAVLLERTKRGAYVTLRTVKVGRNGRARLDVTLKTGKHTLIVRILRHGTNESGATSRISVRIA